MELKKVNFTASCSHNSHCFGESLSPQAEKINHFGWRHKVYSPKNLSCTKSNYLIYPNFYVTLMNVKFIILTKYKIQEFVQNARGSKMISKAIYSSFLLVFYENSHLASN